MLIIYLSFSFKKSSPCKFFLQKLAYFYLRGPFNSSLAFVPDLNAADRFSRLWGAIYTCSDRYVVVVNWVLFMNLWLTELFFAWHVQFLWGVSALQCKKFKWLLLYTFALSCLHLWAFLRFCLQGQFMSIFSGNV